MVFDRVLHRMRESVRERQYVMTLHAEEEMHADELTIYDVERCILTGNVVKRQRDRETAESKYVVQGKTLTGNDAVIVAKFGATGKLVILTTYAL